MYTDGATVLLVLPAVAAVRTAVVYRESGACDNCSWSFSRLLNDSLYQINIKYTGLDEEVDLIPELLSQAAFGAHPGRLGQFASLITLSYLPLGCSNSAHGVSFVVLQILEGFIHTA
jgi:hypothetical protein